MTGRFAGKVGLVTGGASGIGLAVARRLVEAGARVMVADLDEVAGAAAAQAVAGEFVRTDVTDPAANQAAVAATERAFGRVDMVHLNAGITTGSGDLTDLDLDRYRRVTAVNLDGVVFGARAALPALRRSGGGAIVATASLSGLTDYPGDPVYAATKHAVVGLVRALAPTLRADGITVSCVCPGFVETPLLAGFVEQFRSAGFPLLTADEVAGAVLLAAADEGTGQAWVVQPGRPPAPYRFRGVPGPKGVGAEGALPPQRPYRG